VADATPAKWRCAECGVVQSVREIATKGEGSGIGAVGGAVVGGLLGHQVGGGRGQDVATVVGVVGGAVAGNEVEKRVKSGKSYEITVRLEDGSSRVVHEATAPSWRTGDRVKVIGGVIQSNA
jgi:outer membrane lipoprotein SlyB